MSYNLCRWAFVCGFLGLSLQAGEPLLGSKDFMPSPKRPLGYRGDGSGCWPGAEPPSTWQSRSSTNTKNLSWSSAIGQGDSSPLVFGDRVYVLSNGVRLNCLALVDGKEIWHADQHIGSDETLRGHSKLEEAVRRFHVVRALTDNLRSAEASLKVLEEYQSPWFPVSETLLATAHHEFELARAALVEPERLLAELTKDGWPEKSRPDVVSTICTTPVTDGKYLWAFLPTGVAICYDLSGKRCWTRVLGTSRIGGGWGGASVGASPLYQDGKLVIEYDKVYCLDAAKGDILWSQPHRVFSSITPTIAKGADGTSYIATGSQEIFRLDDGAPVVVAGDDPKNSNYYSVSPVVWRDTVIWVSHALRMPAKKGDECTLAWQLAPETVEKMCRFDHTPTPQKDKPFVIRGMGPHAGSPPVIAGGFLYYTQRDGVPYTVLDPATGNLVYVGDRKNIKGNIDHYLAGLSAAGDFVLFPGVQTILFPTGKSGWEGNAPMSNLVSGFRSAPLVFHGRKLFLRSFEKLLCFEEKIKTE